MRATLFAFLSSALLFAAAGSAAAQEGCQQARGSCSAMNRTCEQRCQGGNNPSACVARLCSPALSGCKANGVWKSVASPACWKTNDRS